MDKPPRTFWQIWNMSFGFLGIQFGWGLQMANMSAIYEYLGARADQIPILWLAAPLTGLIVQPIIGHASDRTWGRLGRRRPYFLTGAILSSMALILMPRSSALWMAAGLLWMLDASINISMEPFRAFVADLLPEDQRTRGFAMQSLFIGLGAVIASALPWLLTNVFTWRAPEPQGRFPHRASFVLHRRCCVSGRVLWTIVTTKEYPPDDLEEFPKQKTERRARRNRARNLGVDRRDAAHHAATRLGADLHLDGAVLHVAVFSGGGGAQCVRRRRHKFAALYGGRGVGGHLFRNVFAGVLRFSFVLPALARQSAARPRTVCA